MQEDTAQLSFSVSHRHLTRYGILLHKIKSYFSPDLHAIIKSYLLQRTFRVKFGEVVTQLKDIKAWSITRQRAGTGALSATAGLPVAQDTITAIYADVTAILTAPGPKTM